MYMDILGLLPLEICHQILGYLSVEDLAKCFKVSKKWWEITNCDILWKKHCVRYGLSEPEYGERDTYGPLVLCSWASHFVSFGRTPAYNWHNNKYQFLKLNCIQQDYNSFASHGNYFAAYSKTYYNLDVYSIVKCGCNSSKIKLVCSIALCFPKFPPFKDVTVCMTEEHIIAGKCNMILVFEKNNNNFELYKAIKIGLTHQFATKDIYNFVQQNFNPTVNSEIFGIRECFLWLGVEEDANVVINIYSNEVKNIFSSDATFTMGDYFVTWSDMEEIRVYDKSAKIVTILDSVVGIEEIYANSTLICVLMGEPLRESRIKVWELSTGNNIFCKPMPPFIWMKLHPQNDIFYTLEASAINHEYRITSWDIRSGEKLWVYEQTPPFTCTYMVTCWELIEVCGKYLVSWPVFTGRDNYICIDSKTGKHLYEDRRDSLSSPVAYNVINDKFWLTVSNGVPVDVTVRSFM